MGFAELLIIAVGLSMDAFAVSIAKGLSTDRLHHRHYLSVAVWFGGFQALMPTIGSFLGISFSSLISGWDHWIAFVLLTLIGSNMVRGSFAKDEEEKVAHGFGFWVMLSLAIATSIDALAVGVSFACLDMSIWNPIVIIGLTTMAFSIAGVYLGHLFGLRFKHRAELLGGIVLIGIGVKILFQQAAF